jgi:hexosaminidase
MPWPANVATRSGALRIQTGFSVYLTGAGSRDPRVENAVARLFTRLSRQTGIPFPVTFATDSASATLVVVVESKGRRGPQRLGDDESYGLTVSPGSARLSADAPLGVLRGLETFLQLVEQNRISPGAAPNPGFSVPALSLSDKPRFPWRGLSLDVSRHFIPVDGIRRTIDGLAAVKLNVLHWHLSDDQGFRVESKRFPRLQQLGSDGLFYTQAEIRGIVAYAAARGVRIVPEFDMPGHSTSWFPGYPKLATGAGPFQIVREHGILTAVIDPTSEYTYKFLDAFIGEMARLFPDEYFHIGGDEVNPKKWNSEPHVVAFMAKHDLADTAALHAYFNQRVLKIVTKHGKHMEGWDEILHPGLPKSIVIQSWRGQTSLWDAARQGYQGILSAGYYLDLMYPASYHYSVDPMKAPPPAPFSRPRADPGPPPGTPADLTPEQQKLILGGEAAMWEELADAENVDAKLWPRLAAIAERFWSPASVADSTAMYRRLTATNRSLEWLGLTQRSNLELMRQRLAGQRSAADLDRFASILEPVKGYSRHAQRYGSSTPLNRLVDSIPPESDSARKFRASVDQFLDTSGAVPDPSIAMALRTQLTAWAAASANVRPLLSVNSLLVENLPVADGLDSLCQTGLEALSYFASGSAAAAFWKTQSITLLDRYVDTRIGDLLIQIAPAIRKLVEAVPVAKPKEPTS